VTAEQALQRASQAVAYSFAKVPSNWQVQLDTHERYMLPALRRLADMPPSHVLDVGCGRGTFAVAAQLMGHMVTGIDWFTDLPQIETVRWIKQDIELCDPLPLATGRRQYDVIVLHEVLEHVNLFPVSVLQTIYDALRPGGLFLGSTPDRGTWPEPALYDGPVSGLPEARRSLPRVDGHVRLYSAGEVCTLCQRAGFAPPTITSDATGYHLRWETWRGVWAWVTGPPRSGTSLMQALLNLHPDCVIEGETHLGTNLLEMFRGRGERINYHHCILWRGETVERPHSLPRLQTDDRTALDCARASAWALRNMVGGPLVYGDKSAVYSHEWPAVFEAFPCSRWVIMDRQLEACAESLQRQPWGENDLRAARATVASYRECAAQIPGLTVPLGNLNGDHRQMMERVLNYLGLEPSTYPWDEAAKFFKDGARIN